MPAVCRFGSFLARCPSPPVPPSLRAALIVAYSTFCTLHSALRTRNSFCRLTLRPQVSPCFRFPVPRSLFPAFGSYPQRRMHMRPCKNHQIRVKIGQNGVKIGLKKVKKGAHFVMPILTFGGVIPSGASARAVLASRRGKKGAFRGAKSPGQKLSTSWRRLWITPGFLFAAARPLSAMTATRSVPRSAATAAGMRSGCGVTGWHAQAAVCLGMVCAAATRMPTHTAAWACHPATGRSPP